MSVIDFKETGKIEAYYLKRMWYYYLCLKSSASEAAQNEVSWKYINALFNTLGIGTEPTIKYLLHESPDFETFENWILKNGRVSPQHLKNYNSVILSGEENMSTSEKNNVLSEEDLRHWEEKGYVIVKNAISREDCEKTEALIYEILEATPDDPATWYKPHPLKQGIMVQLFQHDILDKNRFSPRIKNAFEQLWQRTDLLVDMDRVSFNPPETAYYTFPGPNLHWDVSLKRPIPFGLQGLLYVSDTLKDQGAFTVIPGFHNQIDTWLENLPEGRNPRDVAMLNRMTLEPIAGNAGDFIIWNQCLPHGSSPNTSGLPRIVQYINYQPIELAYQEEWI